VSPAPACILPNKSCRWEDPAKLGEKKKKKEKVNQEWTNEKWKPPKLNPHFKPVSITILHMAQVIRMIQRWFKEYCNPGESDLWSLWIAQHIARQIAPTKKQNEEQTKERSERATWYKILFKATAACIIHETRWTQRCKAQEIMVQNCPLKGNRIFFTSVSSMTWCSLLLSSDIHASWSKRWRKKTKKDEEEMKKK